MHYDPDRHHRRSIRLSGYDYSESGAYYITVCTHNRECLLGGINKETVVLSEVGQAVESAWMEIPTRFPFVIVDEYVLMPNHLHGILVFTELVEQPNEGAQDSVASSGHTDSFDIPNKVNLKATLGRVIRAFKSLSAIQANRLLDRAEQPFWQRNYYERIIRDKQEMEQIRAYIRHNPLQWTTDTENPDVQTTL